MLKVLDLFSGIGGFSLGLRWAGDFETIAFAESDPFCRSVLCKHWPDVPIFDDVRKVKADAVGHVDLVTGGFPCQPWSVAGQRNGADDDRDLWPAMRAVVAACRPRWVLGENVPGFVSHPMGLDRVLADLDALGYASQAFCIPACAVGAPHIRDRVWIVAHAAGIGREWREGATQGHVDDWPDAGWLKGNGRSVGSDEDGCVAHALSARPQERAGERKYDGAQRPAAERGGCVEHATSIRWGEGRTKSELRSGRSSAAEHGGVGDAERTAAQRQRGAGEFFRAPREAGREGHQRERSMDTPTSPGQVHWSGAEWLWCEFDQRWRRTQPGIRLLAHGLPQRVARLRALGNAVVPQVVAEIGRAILVAEDST